MYRLLIGNKNDLEDKRVIQISEGKEFASFQGMEFIETSAKTSYKVKDAFEILAREMIRIFGKDNKANNKEKKVTLNGGADIETENKKKKCCK